MSSIAYDSPPEDGFQTYRAVSKAGILSLILAVLGVAGFLAVPLMLLCLLSMLCGVVALRNLKRYPNELTGAAVTAAGLFLGTFGFLGSGFFHATVYLTEVPDGYQRMSFSQLRPKESGKIPTSAKDLDGEKVFVKGYMHPGVKNQGAIREFVLVPDMKTCCFGGQPKLHKMIEVRVTAKGSGLKYSLRKIKLAGEFRVHEQFANFRKPLAGKVAGGLYELQADLVK